MKIALSENLEVKSNPFYDLRKPQFSNTLDGKDFTHPIHQIEAHDNRRSYFRVNCMLQINIQTESISMTFCFTNNF